jgi:hypothetical protein
MELRRGFAAVLILLAFFCAPVSALNCSGEAIAVNVTVPANGSNYFFPSITENVTVSVIGTLGNGSNLTCYFNVGGAWNNFTHCALGENRTYEDSVTFPQGYPLRVSALANTSCGSYSGYSDITVYYHKGLKQDTILVFGVVMLAIIALALVRKRRRAMFLAAG